MPEKSFTVIIPVTFKLLTPLIELFYHFLTGSRTLEYKLSYGVMGGRGFLPVGYGSGALCCMLKVDRLEITA